jgi:DGQHR domain-containing protein
MPYEYPAIFTRQRTGDGAGLLVASFAAPAGDLLEWTTIQQITVGGAGHQRLRNEAKVRAIQRFLAEPRNSIPTAVVVAIKGLPAFDDSALDTCSTLVIPEMEEPPGIVIDGQHRIFGVADFDPNFRINVIGLINPDNEEIVFQFFVINNKATKVATDHVKLLNLNYQESTLRERLKSARLTLGKHASLVGVVDSSPESPFYQAVNWPVAEESGDERHPLVLPAAVEQALAGIASKNLPDLIDDDALIEFFFALWTAVKDSWPQLWTQDSPLLKKVGVVTLTTFVIDDLTPLVDRGTIDIADPDVVRDEVSKILASLTPEFWTSEWTSSSLDTSAGRQLVVDALTQIRRNNRRDLPWYADVDLVAIPDQTEGSHQDEG